MREIDEITIFLHVFQAYVDVEQDNYHHYGFVYHTDIHHIPKMKIVNKFVAGSASLHIYNVLAKGIYSISQWSRL